MRSSHGRFWRRSSQKAVLSRIHHQRDFERAQIALLTPRRPCLAVPCDIDSVLTLYDPEAFFLNQARETRKGDGLREELAPLAEAKAVFGFSIKQIIMSGDIALVHTEWNVSSPEQMSLYAIEVARRQQDGSWRWLFGDPFTVRRNLPSYSE